MKQSEFNALINADIKRLMYPKPKRVQDVCRCEAYKFPHRKYGGECHAGTFQDEDCTCCADPASIVDIDPPEIQRSRSCPVHGIDPDYERDCAIDDRLTGDSR
jgi:hypothetical protein